MKTLIHNIFNLIFFQIYYISGFVRASMKGVKIGEGAKISPYCKLNGTYYLGNVRVARNVFIGRGTYINSGQVDAGMIGNFCSIGYDVHIGPTEHSLKNWTSSPRLALHAGDLLSMSISDKNPPKIMDEVWIGRGVTILRGITIGQGAVIGAGSIVNKNIPDYEVWAGVPARFIKKRFNDISLENEARVKLARHLIL